MNTSSLAVWTATLHSARPIAIALAGLMLATIAAEPVLATDGDKPAGKVKLAEGVKPAAAKDAAKDEVKAPPDKAAKEADAKDKLSKSPELTAEQEAKAWAFVTQQHPELADVLGRLKSANRAEYDRALRQIYVTGERLAKLSKDDAARYDLELRQWKVESRIRLLAARMSLAPADNMDTDLRAAVEEQTKIRLEIMQSDRARFEARIKTLDASIERLQTNSGKEVDARLTELHREIARAKTKIEEAARKSASASPD